MVERGKIIELNTRRGGDPSVLVTLVGAEGSSYRKPGARLLTVGSEYAGTVSGGCLEAEVVKKAAWMVRGGAVLQRYSTAFDDAAEIPYGLGCGGTVDLLLEPSGTAEFEALLHALESAMAGEPRKIVTWLPRAPRLLRRVVLSAGDEVIFRSEGVVSAEIAAALAGERGDVFVEQLAPPQRLTLLGAGDDARPLVCMAALLGWNTTVADGRAQLARSDRFPEARRVLAIEAGRLADLAIARDDAVVIMTHSFEQDLAWLAALLPLAPRYLGVLGARRRSSLLISQVSAAIGLSVAECCERIYAPVGLDLGGDGPEAIALAVIAEVQARCMGRLPASRRLSAKAVAAHIARSNVSEYGSAQCGLGRRQA